MGPVRDMLVSLRLDQYADTFDDEGYDDLPFLMSMDVTALKEVAECVHMKPGHAAKFTALLPNYRPSA